MEPRRTGPFPYVPITQRPRLAWPGGAHVALWVIPNIEFHALDERTPDGTGAIPDLPAWSNFDYGNRVGIFRLMDVLQKHGIRGTVALNSEICDQHPAIITACRALDWEFMGHCESNTRWLGLAGSEEAARRIIFDSCARIESATGKRPRGWLGAGLDESWDTLDHLIAAGLSYVADWCNDDQPYLMQLESGRIAAIPYSTEINDRPAFRRQCRTPEEFSDMIKGQFDVLYEEGAESGRVMAIALHPNLIGVPHRIRALDAALGHIRAHERVWHATGSEIIDHFVGATAEPVA